MLLKHLGSGCRMMKWTKNFMLNCKYSVKIGNLLAAKWCPDVGVSQFRRLISILFNIGCLSWHFCQDRCLVISVDTLEDLNNIVSISCKDNSDWYHVHGFVIEGSKSELMGIGCYPKQIYAISGAGYEMKNEKSLKFLGLHITNDLRWNLQVNKICVKVRYTANRIR